MTQIILVIAFILAAAGYLGWEFYKRFFAKKTKCEGCAIGKANSTTNNS